MKVTKYSIKTSKIKKSINIACVSDVHARKYDRVIMALNLVGPDMILLAGDILEVSNGYMFKRNEVALEFLKKVSCIAPVYYCFGNHEIYYSHTRKEENRIPNEKMLNDNINKINDIGIHIVNDTFDTVTLGNKEKILVGGLLCGCDMNPALNMPEPDLDFLKKYDSNTMFKILLCHYPHYYDTYLKNTSFDIILSGHAHGGQWRFFNRGVYAPHQGIFPKYTSGIYDNRFIISKGAVNNSKPIPRFFNPTEILQIQVSNDQEK